MRSEPPLGRVAARISFPRLQSTIRWTTVFYSPSWKNPSVLLVQPWTGYDHSWLDVFKSSRSGQTNPAPWSCFSVCLRVQSSVHCSTSADIETIIEKHGVKMRLYADDTQLYDDSRVNNIERSVAALEACLQDIVQWSSQRRLKLNPSKTKLIWLDRAHSIEKLQQQPLIRLNSRELSSSPSVRDLGVIIDSGLTLTTHVSILARTCFYQLRRIRQAKKNLDEDAVKTLVHALDNLSSHAWTTATRYWPTCQK